MLSGRLRRLLLWVALPLSVLVLLYAALGFYLVPRLVRSQASAFVQQHYHRSLVLGQVRCNPFALRLEIERLALPDADGRPLLGFGHLAVELTVASVWHLAPDFASILLQQPYVNLLIRPDGSLNLADLELPPAPGAKPASGRPARFFINRLRISDGSLALEDRAHPSEFKAEIKPVTFELRNFTTAGSGGGSYSLSGLSEAGERFSWSGSLQTSPLASRGQFAVGQLRAATIWSFIRDSVHFELPGGQLSLRGEYEFSAGTHPVTLTADVHELTLSDVGVRPAGDPLTPGSDDDYLHVGMLRVSDIHADLGRRALNIGHVQLQGGAVRAWLEPPGVVNLQGLLGPRAPAARPAGASGPAPASAPAPISAPAPPDSQPHAVSSAWTIAVPDIEVQHVKVSAADRMVKPQALLQLSELNMRVSGYSSMHSEPVTIRINSDVNSEGKLVAEGTLSPQLNALQGQVRLDGFNLIALQPLLAARTAMTLASGALSLRLDVQRNVDGQLQAQGEADVAHLRTVDNALNQDFIKFDRLQARGITYRSTPAQLHIRSITAKAPYARLIVESDRTLNIKRVLQTKDAQQPMGSGAASGRAEATASVAPTERAAAGPVDGGTGTTLTLGEPAPGQPLPNAAEEARAQAMRPDSERRPSSGRFRGGRRSPSEAAVQRQGTQGLDLAVDSIELVDGSANYADFWIQPHFAIGIQALQGTITGLSSSPQARARVDLTGKVDRYAPVRIWGETNPLAASGYTDLHLSFKGVQMSSATPYSGRFAGYKIENGKLSVDINYRIQDRELAATHHMVIEQLELGDRVESPDAVHLPVKLAVALLKDRNGVIDLNLPVSGNLDDPQFSLAPLIWKAVVNLFAKVATAPFAVLGRMFGGGEEVNLIQFAPGSAVLDDAAQDKLGSLTRALEAKEKLQLDIPVTWSARLDGPQLARVHLEQQLALPQDPKTRFQLLLHAFQAARGMDAALPDAASAAQRAQPDKSAPADLTAASEALEAQLLQSVPVPDEELQQLGKQRAQAIQSSLLKDGQIDPSRVFVIGSAPSRDEGQNPKAAVTGDKVQVELALK